MKKRTQTRDVPALSMRAAVQTVDEKARTVDVTFSTGARVLRNSFWDGPSYEELSMDPAHVRMGRLQSGNAPFLADHYAGVGNVLGVISAARIENGKGIATVRFPSAGTDERADQVFEKIRQGIIGNVSVGYRTYRAEKAGKAPYAGDEVPVFRAVDWEPHEVSAVAIGADAAAGFRSEEQSNACVFVTPEEKIVDEEQKKRDAETAKLAADKAKADEATRKAELDAAAERGAQVERERVSLIQRGVKAAKLDEAFGQKLIDDKTPADKARELIFDALAKRSEETAVESKHTSGISVGEEDREKFVRGATSAILARSGTLATLAATVAGVKSGAIKTPGVRHAFKDFNVDEDGGELRGLSLVALARESLERRGISTRRMTDYDMVGHALTHRSGGEAATISDFSVLLENVMYKVLLGAYAQAADTWREFCGTDSVQDFRPANRFRTGSFGVMDLKPEGAEYIQKSIPDGLKFAITTQTYGNKMAVSREAIISDDMGAITDTMAKFGRAAGLTIEKAVFELLALNSDLGPTISLGGTSAPLLDDTAWANISSHTVLGVAGLDADRVKLAQQKDISNNEYLNLRPSVLLVPLALEAEANLLNTNRYDPTASTAFERMNVVNGMFKKIVGSPRITGTRRYLFVDPAEVAALKVVFLNGAQTPYMETRQGWNVDGVEQKLRIDFKAQAFDPKGILTNAGTA